MLWLDPLEESLAMAKRAAGELPPGTWRVLARTTQGALSFALGDDTDAIGAFSDASAEAHAIDAPTIEAIGLAHLALVLSATDQPDQALHTARQARQLMRNRDLEHMPTLALVVAASALVESTSGSADVARGDLLAARGQLKLVVAQTLDEHLQPRAIFPGYVAMIGADIAQSELGYTGAGIRVAVMDTGIDYDHPDLGGCFGPGCRVAMGYDFVGDDFNADIEEYMRKAHNLSIGERTAERVKIEVGAAMAEIDNPPPDFPVHGRHLLSGIPREVMVSHAEIAQALDKTISKIEAAILNALENTPPELSADILNTGIYMAGGGSLLRGLDKRIEQKTKLKVHVAEDPLRAVARGAGIALKNFDRFPFLIK